MRVVIDTSVFRQSYWLNNTAFTVLLDGCGSAGHSLYTSAVVYEELLNLYREALEEKVVALTRATRDWDQLVFQNPAQQAPIDKDQPFVAYREFVDETFDMYGITVLPYPLVTHEDVVRRDLARRKPFAKGGKGYRDTLIWESVIELASDGLDEPVVFITENSSDFLENRERLHPDLAADLGAERITASEVTVLVGLQSFNQQYIEPVLAELTDLGRQIQAGLFEPLNLEAFVTGQLLEFLNSKSSQSLHTPFHEILEAVAISSINPVERVYNVVVRRMVTNSYFIRFASDAVLSLTYSASRTIYEHFPEDVRLAFPASEESGQTDLIGSIASRFRLEIALVFNTDAGAVTIAEIWDAQMLNDPEAMAATFGPDLSDRIDYYRRSAFYSSLRFMTSRLGGREISKWHALLFDIEETVRRHIALNIELASLRNRN